jgi:hypothetical protein
LSRPGSCGASFFSGGHPAAGGPFSILRFAEPTLPDLVYLEQLTSALYIDKRVQVERYTAVMDQLCPQVLNLADSRQFLAHRRNEVGHEPTAAPFGPVRLADIVLGASATGGSSAVRTVPTPPTRRPKPPTVRG